MKKVLVFNGSPRKSGNTSHLLFAFIQGAKVNTVDIEEIDVNKLNLKHCTGCLRCNMIKHCSLREDDWNEISRKILDADVLVFGSPVYFHHVTGPLKILIDRFRSFVHVRITESGLVHTPHISWKKEMVLILSMGSSDDADAKPVIDLFEYLTEIMGDENNLYVLTGTRLAVTNHVIKSGEELKLLYPKLVLPASLAANDALKNRNLLESCSTLGKSLTD
jgi:NAD(P)H-dependent FMN reductase